MNSALADNEVIPPPPARYVSPSEKKKMKKAAEGMLERGGTEQGSDDVERGGKVKEATSTAVSAASTEEDRPTQ
jgi:hypothetical protein